MINLREIHNVAKKSSTEKDIEKKDSGDVKKNKSDKDKNNAQESGVVKLQNYFRASFLELKKIQWPARKQVIAETIVVLITVTFMTGLITLFDKIIVWVLSFIIVN